MAVQLLGIATLGALAGELLGKLVGWIAKFTTRKVALNLGLVVLLLGMIGTFIGVLEATIAAVVYFAPDEITHAFAFFVPVQAKILLSTVVSIKISEAAFQWYKNLLLWNFRVQFIK